MKQPEHDRLHRTPTWIVQGVFDPDGGGKDFAYTIGLFERGLPELHMWARPDRGEDPGEDWKLSMNDQCGLLNSLAWKLIDGEIEVGSCERLEYDDGTAIVDLRVDQPGDRDLLEAFGIDPGALILPVTWSLTRPPVGPLVPLAPVALEDARREYADTLASLPSSRRRAPSGWELPAAPSYSPDLRFGPLTPLVLVRAAQLWHADVAAWNRLFHYAMDVTLAGSLTFPAAMARAAARPVGRVDALAEVFEASRALVDQLAGRRRLWSEVLASVWGPADLARHHRERDQQTRHLAYDVTVSCLAVEAVADVISPEWLVHARGPWLFALRPEPGEVPGDAWVASPEVVAAVVDLLSGLEVRSLGEITLLHDRAQMGLLDDWPDYADVAATLTGWALVGAAACPWEPALASLPGLRAWLGDLDQPWVSIAPVPELQEWASCVTAALTHRTRLSARQVEVFAGPFRQVVPRLEAVLNSPVVAA